MKLPELANCKSCTVFNVTSLCPHLSSGLSRQVLYDKFPPRLIRLYDEFLLATDAISPMHISYAGAISCGAKLARVFLVFTISQKQLQASRQYRSTRVGNTAARFTICIFGEKSAEVERENCSEGGDALACLHAKLRA